MKVIVARHQFSKNVGVSERSFFFVKGVFWKKVWEGVFYEFWIIFLEYILNACSIFLLGVWIELFHELLFTSDEMNSCWRGCLYSHVCICRSYPGENRRWGRRKMNALKWVWNKLWNKLWASLVFYIFLMLCWKVLACALLVLAWTWWN